VTFDGGPGNDRFVGGPRADHVDAGAGNDTNETAGDNISDTIVCGDGRDTVTADSLDTIAADCEGVTRV
jgi:hypothetical protein